jgi:hypothetical protein
MPSSNNWPNFMPYLLKWLYGNNGDVETLMLVCCRVVHR